MSTRSCIARRKGDGFEGVYHHWDGYPTGLGATLWGLAQEKDSGLLLEELINKHPAGWSTINGGLEGAECYCHSRNEPDQIVTQEDDLGMEWAYVFDKEANTMAVLERIRSNGNHAIGMFGTLGEDPETGKRDDAWTIRWVGRVDGPEPNWEELEQ